MSLRAKRSNLDDAIAATPAAPRNDEVAGVVDATEGP